MLTALSDAIASALNLPTTAVEVLGIQRRRRLLVDLTLDLLITAPVEPTQLSAMDLGAVAQASGLPIVIKGIAAIPERITRLTVPKPPATTPRPPSEDKTITITLAIVGAIIGSIVLVAIVVFSLRRPGRIADEEDFSNMDVVSATLAHDETMAVSPPSFTMPRLSRYNF